VNSSHNKAIRHTASQFTDESCPECGSPLQIEHCTREGGSVFIWFACTRPDCNGQLLRKFSSGSRTPYDLTAGPLGAEKEGAARVSQEPDERGVMRRAAMG